MSTIVTVVVPSYNSEKVIGQCLDSILAQTFQDFEIIVVDDGSTDGTVETANEYAKKDRRIKVVPKEHENAGVSRNVGLDMAEGEYIVFWDSDDFFEPNALELLYNKCKEDDADICICDAWHYNDRIGVRVRGKKNNYIYVPEEIPYNRKTVQKYILNISNNVPWNKMFRLAFIREKGIRFQSIEKANDALFVMSSMALADRITIIEDMLINWRMNQENSTTTDKKRNPMCVFKAFETTKEFLEQKGVYEEVKQSFINRAVDSYLYALKCQKNPENPDGFRMMYDYIRNEAFKKLGVDNLERSYIYKENKADLLSKVTDGSYEEYILWREEVESEAAIRRFEKKERSMQKQYDKLQARYNKLYAKNERLNQKYERMKNSFAYRVGMKVTWLPRKINALINGKPDTTEKEQEEVIENEVENIIDNEPDAVENDSENDGM